MTPDAARREELYRQKNAALRAAVRAIFNSRVLTSTPPEKTE
jgi:hypothetical protein